MLMKSEEEIRKQIKRLETQKKEASFNECGRINACIESLKWVLDSCMEV